MTRAWKRLGAALIAAVAIGGIALWYLRNRGEKAKQASREAAVAAPSRAQNDGGESVVQLDTAALARAGILTSVLSRTRQPARISLPGELVTDPGQLTVVRAPVSGRLSSPAGARWPAVGDRLAAGSLIAQVSDALPTSVARGGTVTAVAAQPGEIVQAGQVLLTLVDFDRLLARLVWRPDQLAPPPASLSVGPLDRGVRSVRADLVGPAPEVDSLTRLPAFWYRLRQGWLGARPGLPVLGSFPDPRTRQAGILVPAPAVVQWNGFLWIYLQRGPGRFARIRLSDPIPTEGGWLVPSGVPAGATIVVRGAELLLSEEFRSGQTPPGEESERR